MIFRIALAFLATLGLAMWQSGGCGYDPDPLKGEGEPCTRTSECQSALTCRGGVCMRDAPDAGDPGLDAGGEDSGMDAGQDAGDAPVDAGGEVDAEPMDGATGEAGSDASADAAMM